MSRFFSGQQRIALFLAAQGQCQQCGATLAAGWHGDHVIPASKDGPTNVLNGQALCPACNLRKGNRMTRMYLPSKQAPVTPWVLAPRRWQAQCLDTLIEKMERDGKTTLAIAACMGTGKTILILRWLHILLESQRAQIGIVVVPTDNLRIQFCQDAKLIGLHAYALTTNPDDERDPSKRISCIPALNVPLPADIHILVLTYAQLTKDGTINALCVLCAEGNTAWAFDEVHHSGDGFHEEDDALRWADGMLRTAKHAAYRLLTTATPNRTDGRPIPFMPYVAQRPVFDFMYDYESALRDGCVRPIEFRPIDSEGSLWTSDEGDVNFKLSEPTSKKLASKQLNTVVDPRFTWVAESLDSGQSFLTGIRHVKHPDAGGLVVVRNKDDAKEVAAYLKRRHGVRAVIVTYEDRYASAKINNFRTSADEWIVAVRMVSEGVDIKRLRVLVYCTNITTELLFLQIMGRILRVIDGIHPQIAYMIVPEDPRIMAIVAQYRLMIAGVLRIPGEGPPPPPPKQLSAWYGIDASYKPDGLIHDGTEKTEQDYLAIAEKYAHGDPDLESALARALKDMEATKTTASAPHAAAPATTWDRAKHELLDQIKGAEEELRSVRIQQYPRGPERGRQAAAIAIALNGDLLARFGAVDVIRHNTAILERKLAWLQERIIKESGDDTGA